MIHYIIIIFEALVVAGLVVYASFAYDRLFRSVEKSPCKSRLLKIFALIVINSIIYFLAQSRWLMMGIFNEIPDMDNILWYCYDYSWMIKDAYIIYTLTTLTRRWHTD